MLEVLMVVAIMGILAGMMLPSMSPSTQDQLQSAVNVVAADVAYARSLAVANNSRYHLTFSLQNNRYTLAHTSDANTGLDTLPKTPFESPEDTATQHVVRFDTLPEVGPTLQLAAVRTATTKQAVTDVEFGPLGETTRSEGTVIWLKAGGGAALRYMSVSVDPVTGLTTIGTVTCVGPQ